MKLKSEASLKPILVPFLEHYWAPLLAQIGKISAIISDNIFHSKMSAAFR